MLSLRCYLAVAGMSALVCLCVFVSHFAHPLALVARERHLAADVFCRRLGLHSVCGLVAVLMTRGLLALARSQSHQPLLERFQRNCSSLAVQSDVLVSCIVARASVTHGLLSLARHWRRSAPSLVLAGHAS
jgi:hypothetical protein